MTEKVVATSGIRTKLYAENKKPIRISIKSRLYVRDIVVSANANLLSALIVIQMQKAARNVKKKRNVQQSNLRTISIHAKFIIIAAYA